MNTSLQRVISIRQNQPNTYTQSRRQRNVSAKRKWLSIVASAITLAALAASVFVFFFFSWKAADSETTTNYPALELSKVVEGISQEPKELPYALEPASPAPHTGRLIIIDPGHQAQAMNQHAPIGPGATQTRPMVAAGTRGVSTGVAEYIVVLDIGLKLRDALIEEGYEVYMVRETHDVQISNKDRALRGNELGGDIMVRLHCDGSPNPNVHGFMTLIPANGGWTEPIYAKSRQAGEHVHREVLAAIGAYDRGIIERGDLSGFNWSTIPSILLEMGVMTNAREDELLSDPDYQNKIVQGIVNGLNAYFAEIAE